MTTIYCCRECGANLSLHAAHLFPLDFYFESGNKDTLSFSAVDSSKFRFEKEDKIRPFFETVNYWGIQRKRTKIMCNSCGKLVGYIYDDGPPLTDSIGQFGFGPSQVVPRSPRYRFKNKALSMVNPSSPPPIARLPRILALKPMVWSVVASSVTQQVIANYWKQRRMIEEDHLSEAIKTVARIRSRNLSDNDYLDFVHSLELEDDENSQRQRE